MTSFDEADPTAIIIDDDRVSIQLFRDILRMMNIQVLASGYDGKDAVHLYKKYRPDIVFTDILMPENDGFFALEEIRKIDSHAKVVAVTADLTDETATKLQKMNISAVIYKPYDTEDIRKMLYEKYQIKTR
jgi:DNA-binding NarL/FixJ family response regulator